MDEISQYLSGDRSKAGLSALTTGPRRFASDATRARRRDYWRKNSVRLGATKRDGVMPTRPQPDACECCGERRGAKRLHVDHCHKTKAFRGWVCLKCNTGIGKLGDSLEGLLKAVAYLRATEPSNTLPPETA